MEILLENDFESNLDRSLLSIIEKEKFINYTIEKRRVSSDSGNYLGILYEIEVSGRTKDEEKELHLFVKQIVACTSIKIISVPKLYATELFAYKELFKILAELQEQANIPLEERYQTIKIYEESNEHAIIMENICKKGFIASHRMNVQSLNFYEIAIKELAKFHVLSFALEETNPKYFTEKIKPLKHPIIFGEDYKKFVQNLRDVGMKHVDEKFKDKLDIAYEDLIYKYGQYCNDPTIKVCLRHGDYKFNNLMITKDVVGVKQKLIPIDYQLLQYGSPVFDFLFLIFTGTDREFRQAHLLNLKDLYYETLRNYLKYFNMDVDTVYPRKDFEKVYKDKLDFGLMTALLCLPLLFATDAVPNVLQTDRQSPYDDGIKSRYQDLLEDFIEWGYL